MINPAVNPQLRALLGPPILRPEMGAAAPGAQLALPEGGGKSFAETLRESISEVNKMQLEADQAIEKLVTGEKPDIQGTLIALQKADLSFKVMMEVRNKILSAYQELVRMG
jgi:flagellar hook-basal body complex protein FliE